MFNKKLKCKISRLERVIKLLCPHKNRVSRIVGGVLVRDCSLCGDIDIVYSISRIKKILGVKETECLVQFGFLDLALCHD